MAQLDQWALRARGIKKSFSGVEVLHGVDFNLRKGTTHGLVGANGAGKSTLMKILNGVYRHDAGQIELAAGAVDFKSPLEAADAGIAMVFQEFSLVPTMSVCENIFLGREPLKKGGLLEKKKARERAARVLKDLEVDIDLDEAVENLPVGTQQVVEIAKAISKDCKVLILDEPTASLSQKEIGILFRLLEGLKARGIAIIIITHHLQEVTSICDYVTVLRDGNVVMDSKIAVTRLDDIITALVGKDVEKEDYASIGASAADYSGENLFLKMKNVHYGQILKDVSLELHRGEVLGLAGLLGSGRTEILKIIYGLLKPDSGEMVIHGQSQKVRHPAESQKLGINFVPENRHKDGIIKGQSVVNNVMLPVWRSYTRWGFLKKGEAAKRTEELIRKLKIKTLDGTQLVEQLSGGNQQKAVIAKAIAGSVDILLLDEPTVGVDIASKQEILGAVRELAEEGRAVLMVSSEMEELAQVCDRVLILKDGELIKEYRRGPGEVEITEDLLMAASQGVI